MWPNSEETTDLVKFTGKILNGKGHFFAVKLFLYTRDSIAIQRIEYTMIGV